MAGLDKAAVVNSVSPQGCVGAIARRIPEFAILEHNLDGTRKRLHRNLETAWQACLVLCGLERIPQYGRIVDESIAGIERLWYIKACEASLRVFGVGCLVP
jgi:hypothetical protein